MKKTAAIIISVVMTLTCGVTVFAYDKPKERLPQYSMNKLTVVSDLKAAKAGEVVYVYESDLSKSKLPYYIFEELAKTDNVTLEVVSGSGETADFKAGNIPEEGKYSFFTVDELLEIAKN